MRVMLKATFDMNASNAGIKGNTISATLDSILSDLKPEAAYFLPLDGKRAAILFLDLADPSQIPAAVEPFFIAFNADVEITPAMAAEDLMKAGPSIEAAVKKYS